MKGDRDDGDTYWNQASQVELATSSSRQATIHGERLENSRREDADIERNCTAANYGLS
jgi:hypothetical protein